jgi:NAD(P)H-dependent FMN reductase
MNERLEIAARLMAGTHANPSYNQTMRDAIKNALDWADALIARERETRPKCEPEKPLVECSHSRACGSSNGPIVCMDCGEQMP